MSLLLLLLLFLIYLLICFKELILLASAYAEGDGVKFARNMYTRGSMQKSGVRAGLPVAGPRLNFLIVVPAEIKARYRQSCLTLSSARPNMSNQT
jgi:hypothetical protein